MCTPLVTYETPPTYFRTGKITSAFQVWLHEKCKYMAHAYCCSVLVDRLTHCQAVPATGWPLLTCIV
jgi:hypothetical protein